VELRQYTLKPGRRDDLIDLFDSHFVESQESVGMTVIGQFRDRGRPDRFVWLRGFPDMEARHRALEAFYGGPIWAAHKAVANDTMLEFDDVLLLRPARPETAFRAHPGDAGISRPAAPATVLAGIYPMSQRVDAALVSRFERQIEPILEANDVRREGLFMTEPARNTFSSLPVREGENVLAWFGTVEDGAPDRGWLDRLADATILGNQRVSLLKLEPTSRSRLGHGPHAARAHRLGG
jgi:hypothetical protein